MDSFAAATMRDVLGMLPSEADTLRWLRGQLAAVEGTPRSLPRMLQRDLELALDQMRRDMSRLVAIREQCPTETSNLTDDQIVDRARALREPFQQGLQEVLDNEMPYALKRAEIQRLGTELEARYAGDGLDRHLWLWAAPPAQIVGVLDLWTRHLAWENALKAGIALYIILAETGHLPEMLPDHMLKEPFSDQDFTYEATSDGFVLRCQAKDLGLDKIWEYEFRVQN